ncbi:DM13 domain-containing protein [Streptomyces sp. NPDC048612]|uniref:DM13 domain-containing protein n=1 Tax=Streptomyces sp. NPDC048612 TaxID=3365579 RepID=UPI0037107D3D
MSRRIYLPLVLVLVVVAGAGLALFQPWKAFSDTTVNESLPSASAPMKDGPQGKGNAGMKGEEMKGEESSSEAGMQPKDLAEGRFVSHEHDTTGNARTVRLADGGQVLRLEHLKTSEGPDVRVYLSARSADGAESGLGDGAVELGKLKGNLGNQNYAVPAGTNLSKFRSVVIWCERFSVSFGAADLTPMKR